MANGDISGEEWLELYRYLLAELDKRGFTEVRAEIETAESLNTRICSLSNSVRELSFATSSWPLQQQWFVKLCGEVNGDDGDWVGEIAGAP
jgi:hypothetical protein